MFPLSSAVTVAPLAMLAVGTVKLPTKMVSTVAPLVNPLPLTVIVCRGTAVEGDSVIGARWPGSCVVCFFISCFLRSIKEA